ncbi:hypothetical protein Sjap_006270 [Stephania japonica]|uniref:Uncharacterized protein n=1 Tax=Stephania japonica TaxID=461633 RepID=A0AAP0K5L0_9MAGN
MKLHIYIISSQPQRSSLIQEEGMACPVLQVYGCTRKAQKLLEGQYHYEAIQSKFDEMVH